MIPKQKSKRQFSFDIKILNSNNDKKYIRNSSNLKETKDIFIRKQDIYLIKLLEKRIKLTKMLKNKNKNVNQKMIKIINPMHFQYNLDDNKTTNNFVNKKIKKDISNYQNIKIKYNNEYNSYFNYEKDKSNALNYLDNLITSKIYNKNNSKNNKNILKLINKNNNLNYNYNYNFTNAKNFFKTKNHNNNSKIKLPKIKDINNNKTIRNNRNILKSEDVIYNYKTIIIKEKNNIGNNNNNSNSNISFTEKRIFQDNSGVNVDKSLQNNNIYKDRSLSPIKLKKFKY
jgi:hypothetical protein